MIQVKFRAPRSRQWRQWRSECDLALAKLITDGPPYKIDEAIYKGCRDVLLAAYANKCAYCEGPLGAQVSIQVEHYRPKGGVRNLSNRVVYMGPKQPHPGYWWLAYDPSNLLPACSMCNTYTRKAGGKGERFPLPDKGFRASNPGEEKRENPLLIHPARENPALCLGIDLETGFLEGYDERGRASIDVFGLNREGLVEERLRAGQFATLQIRESHRRKKLPPAAMKLIADQLAGRLPYSFVWIKVNEQMVASRSAHARGGGGKGKRGGG